MQGRERVLGAFTLAEVLITLAIIGVVAALTLPSVIQKQTEKITVTKLKKDYALVMQAISLAQIDNGYFKYGDAKEFYDYISPYLKIQKYCGGGRGCWPETTIKFLGGAEWVNLNDINYYQKAILADGTLLQLYSINDFAEIRMDVNGFKGPNTTGKDIFEFKITGPFNTGVPYGLPGTDAQFPLKCDRRNTASYSYNGEGCTAWVIFKENMDYLHCDDLDWDTKNKCD